MVLDKNCVSNDIKTKSEVVNRKKLNASEFDAMVLPKFALFGVLVDLTFLISILFLTSVSDKIVKESAKKACAKEVILQFFLTIIGLTIVLVPGK